MCFLQEIPIGIEEYGWVAFGAGPKCRVFALHPQAARKEVDDAEEALGEEKLRGMQQAREQRVQFEGEYRAGALCD